MRTRLAIVASAALVLLATDRTAHAATVQGVDCSEVQMLDKARSLGTSSTAHIVWNPTNGTVRRYRDSCRSAPRGTVIDTAEARESLTPLAAGTLRIKEVAITTELAQVAHGLGQIRCETGRTVKGAIRANIAGMPFPTYLPGKPTAHDFLMDGELRANLLDLASSDRIFKLNSTSVLHIPLSVITSQFRAFLAMPQRAVVRIDVIFHDRSTVRLRRVVGDKAIYVADSARDGSGHVLPDLADTPQRYSGRWYYPSNQSDDMAAFIEYMRSLGVTVTTGGNAGNGVINCTWNPTNNTTTCYIPR